MSRRLILHIGPHKTGSTYLQQRLQQDRDVLLARLGVCYPRTGQDFLFGHHSLADVFRGPADRPVELAALRSELADHQTAIISSERFCQLNRTQFERVRDGFADFDVEVVTYLRVRSELVVSHWAETVKHGRDHSLPEFLMKILVAPSAHPLINQTLLLDTVASVFGRGSLRVLLYRPDVDLYPEFVETILGSPSFVTHSAGRHASVNASLPVYGTECLRLLHYMARMDGRHDPRELTSGFMRVWGTGARRDEFALFHRCFEERAATVDLRGLDRDFRHLEETLAARYGDRLANGTLPGGLPESRVTAVPYLRDLDAVTAPDFADALARIYPAVTSRGFIWPRAGAVARARSDQRSRTWWGLIAPLAGWRRGH